MQVRFERVSMSRERGAEKLEEGTDCAKTLRWEGSSTLSYACRGRWKPEDDYEDPDMDLILDSNKEGF